MKLKRFVEEAKFVGDELVKDTVFENPVILSSRVWVCLVEISMRSRSTDSDAFCSSQILLNLTAILLDNSEVLNLQTV